eukprot:6481091-Pyramimonas_sp.AAC.1
MGTCWDTQGAAARAVKMFRFRGFSSRGRVHPRARKRRGACRGRTQLRVKGMFNYDATCECARMPLDMETDCTWLGRRACRGAVLADVECGGGWFRDAPEADIDRVGWMSGFGGAAGRACEV